MKKHIKRVSRNKFVLFPDSSSPLSVSPDDGTVHIDSHVLCNALADIVTLEETIAALGLDDDTLDLIQIQARLQHDALAHIVADRIRPLRGQTLGKVKIPSRPKTDDYHKIANLFATACKSARNIDKIWDKVIEKYYS